MAKHSSRTSNSKRKTVRDSSSDVLKKMNSISDATKILANEVKSMSKIFAENQKILISLKNMIDAVGSSLEQIQRNARQINVLEEDTQKLFTGLSQIKAHSNLISKVNDQTDRLQDQVNKIREKQESLPDVNKVMQSVANSLDSIRNNTKMIMHVSDKTEKIRDEIKDVSAKAEKITQLEQNITNLKQDIGAITSKTESLVNMSSDIRDVGIELGSLVRKTDSLATFGADIRNVGTEFTNFRENVLGKTKQIDEKISELTELLNRNSAATSEFHKRTHDIHQELQEIRNITHKTSQNTSREVVGLLRLAEFQSNIRMHSESKYGTLDDLDKMISQTVDMVNLFDRLSLESEKKIPLPQEVKQWSVSKILDCADRWEIRFTDVFRLLINQLGRDLIKESMRIEQVRDLFGIRAVDEIRTELGIP
ncbi:MAG TPA: chemotaxis protein [Nitrosopumilaceae archaeon]|nr:chemotaxis protein [Nitrosopumilaceae archaeon]